MVHCTGFRGEHHSVNSLPLCVEGYALIGTVGGTCGVRHSSAIWGGVPPGEPVSYPCQTAAVGGQGNVRVLSLALGGGCGSAIGSIAIILDDICGGWHSLSAGNCRTGDALAVHRHNRGATIIRLELKDTKTIYLYIRHLALCHRMAGAIDGEPFGTVGICFLCNGVVIGPVQDAVPICLPCLPVLDHLMLAAVIVPDHWGGRYRRSVVPQGHTHHLPRALHGVLADGLKVHPELRVLQAAVCGTKLHLEQGGLVRHNLGLGLHRRVAYPHRLVDTGGIADFGQQPIALGIDDINRYCGSGGHRNGVRSRIILLDGGIVYLHLPQLHGLGPVLQIAQHVLVPQVAGHDQQGQQDDEKNRSPPAQTECKKSNTTFHITPSLHGV